MICKSNRLSENEVKKVLQKWKPFFSYGMVLNSIPNRLSHNRFAIVVWSKSVKTNVTRNFFRRIFYDATKDIVNKMPISWKNIDLVFVVKKQTKLDKKDKKTILSFMSDLSFILNKTFDKVKIKR